MQLNRENGQGQSLNYYVKLYNSLYTNDRVYKKINRGK